MAGLCAKATLRAWGESLRVRSRRPQGFDLKGVLLETRRASLRFCASASFTSVTSARLGQLQAA